MEMQEEEDGRVWGQSEVLNLGLWWEDGELRFWDPVKGDWLLSHDEEQGRRLAAESRADEERAARIAAEARTEEERSGRVAVEARLAELETELRPIRGESEPSLPVHRQPDTFLRPQKSPLKPMQ